MSYYLTIIGTMDNPLYELEFSSFKAVVGSNASNASIAQPATAGSGTTSFPGHSQFHPQVREILPFVAHSSLDIIEDATWATNQFYLGRVDSFYGLIINAFVTQGNIKVILCVDTGLSNFGSAQQNTTNLPNIGSASSASSITVSKSDENSIKQFFMEVNDLYVKCLLNPLYAVNDPITSPDFDFKVKQVARKYL